MKKSAKKVAKAATYSYPEDRQTRSLRCVLTPAERADACMENARLVGEISQLNEEAKSVAATYKAKIKEREARLGYVSTMVIENSEPRQVACRWHYECDASPGKEGSKKALIREDTGAVIEIVPMSAADFEKRELPLDGEGGEA